MRASADFDSLLDYRWESRPEAGKSGIATMPFQDFAGLAPSVELLLEVGVERITTHIRHLLIPLVDWLMDRPETEIVSDLRPEHSSGIFCFRTPAPEAAIRLASHLYTTEEEIGRVIEAMEGLRT